MSEGGENEATLPCRGLTLRRPRLSLLLAWLGAAAILLLTPALAVVLGWFGVFLGVTVATSSWVAAVRFARSIYPADTLELGAGGTLRIRIGRGLVRTVSPAQVDSGYEAPARSSVVLLLHGGSQLVLRLDPGDVRRVLDHAGVGPTQRVLSLPLRRTLGAFTIGFIAVWPLLLFFVIATARLVPGSHGAGLLVALAMTAASTAAVVRRLGFPRVVIGTDGVRLRGLLRPRFIAYDAIASVRLVAARWVNDPNFVELTLRGGEVLALPTIGAPRERLEAITRRIEEGARAHASGDGRRFEALRRGGRTASAWKDDVTRLALAPAGFRHQALEHDDFERVLDDAGAPPDARVGAALALRALDPEGAPTRIRIAAGASADEALREALDAAAEGDVEDRSLLLAQNRRPLNR